MRPEELRRKQIELSRALRAGRDAEAEQLAVELAPHFDAVADAEDDRHPSPIYQWGCEA